MRQITVFKQIQATNHLLITIGLALVMIFLLAAAHQVSAATESTDSSGHLITVYDGDFEKTFITTEKTVAAALKAEDIALESADHVEPMAKTELVAGSYSVNVYRARPVTVIDGAKQTLVLTSSQSPKKIVEQTGDKLHPEDITSYQQAADPLESGGAGLNLVVDRATEFEFTLYGSKFTARTQAETVGQMLKEKDIVLSDKDGVSLPLDTKIRAGMDIKVWRDGKQTITVEESIEKSIEEIKDADREVGYRQIKTPGQDGKAKVTYEIIMRDGIEIKRKKIASVTIDKPVKEVVVVGAKSSYTGGPLSEAQINALGQCETGMNPTTNTGNGFYGAFQFMPSTWRAVHHGPYNMPHEAPLDVQKQAVQDLLSRSSIYTQFPGCAAKMQASGIL